MNYKDFGKPRPEPKSGDWFIAPCLLMGIYAPIVGIFLLLFSMLGPRR